MIKPFDTLYLNLEKVLKRQERKYQGAERYLLGLEAILEAVGKLRVQGSKYVRPGETEVTFFREVWPVFHGRRLLFICLHEIELERESLALTDWQAVLAREETRVTTFFRKNWEFWRDLKSGAREIDVQFTRTYGQARLLDPLGPVIDPECATLGSYDAAWCLAMHGYTKWLKEERALLSAGTTSGADIGYSFGGSDADLGEWLAGLQAVGAIQYKGQPVDMSRMQKWARFAVGREVRNIYDRIRVLRNRKKERLVFTKKTESALKKKWDQAEGKFD